MRPERGSSLTGLCDEQRYTESAHLQLDNQSSVRLSPLQLRPANIHCGMLKTTMDAMLSERGDGAVSVASTAAAASSPASPARRPSPDLPHPLPSTSTGSASRLSDDSGIPEEGAEERQGAKRLANRLFHLDGFQRADVATQLAARFPTSPPAPSFLTSARLAVPDEAGNN